MISAGHTNLVRTIPMATDSLKNALGLSIHSPGINEALWPLECPFESPVI